MSYLAERDYSESGPEMRRGRSGRDATVPFELNTGLLPGTDRGIKGETRADIIQPFFFVPSYVKWRKMDS